MSERQARIIEMVRSGMTRTQVARQLGIGLSTVSRVCIPVLGRTAAGRKLACDRAQLRRLYDAGCNDAEIARQVGCCISSVCEWRMRAGLPRQAYGAEAAVRQAVDLVDAGATYAAAARQCGITRNQVAGAVHRARQRGAKVRGSAQTGTAKRYDKAKIRRLYDQGLNDAEIARRMGCWASAVQRQRQAGGLPSQAAVKNRAMPSAVAMVEAGASMAAAARRFGLKYWAVQYAVARAKRAKSKPVAGQPQIHT